MPIQPNPMTDQHWAWFNSQDQDEQVKHLWLAHSFTFSEDEPTTIEEAHDSAHFKLANPPEPPPNPDRAKLLEHLLTDHAEQYEEGFIEQVVWLACQTTENLNEHHADTHTDEAELGISEPASEAHLNMEGEPNYILGGPAHT